MLEKCVTEREKEFSQTSHKCSSPWPIKKIASDADKKSEGAKEKKVTKRQHEHFAALKVWGARMVRLTGLEPAQHFCR